MSKPKSTPSAQWLAHCASLSDTEREYDKRVTAYEAEGMTRSDAQGVVDAEDMRRWPA